jgi:putative membrane protein
MLRWLLAAAHLLALGIGLGAVWARSRALRGDLDLAGLRRAFVADAWWGAAAVLWIGTGLWRLFGSTEKDTSYYLHNHVFWAKMALLGVILVIEMGPAVTLGRWRRSVAKGESVDTRPAARLAGISVLEAAIVVLMVLAATAMARGYGMPH